MLQRTVWDAPFASLKKEVSFKPETELGYVTSNCMRRAVRQFEKEVSFRLATGVENASCNCMGRAVRQFKKEVSFKLAKGRKCYIELYGTRRPPVRKRSKLLA